MLWPTIVDLYSFDEGAHIYLKPEITFCFNF